MKKILLVLIFSTTLSCLGKIKEEEKVDRENKKEYVAFIKEILSKRNTFKQEYIASSPEEKKIILQKARLYLVSSIGTELFPYWYGTKWDFNGTTRIPKQGKIACGYFITNILTDVGFDIPRVKWAQSASEVFIKRLAKNKIKRFVNKPIENIEKYLVNSGDGLYLVGLDSHTGFIYVNKNKVRFIHADYYEPEKGVVSEKLNSYSPIAYSKYRVIGKLMSDEMIESWIMNKRIS
ncbi:hypothetical protein [Tenacibaculum jejuense]|uniref:Lipoprotein n=1 Tax=Tenacibaculum jejuense TaxID=584609 RepID=A0A238UCG3_9FLAO|nr:hypothetical protein [Tenacibaculum jejuense]SNR16861.1 conserved protein of unknown function [Tenacibaculum jejuense]